MSMHDEHHPAGTHVRIRIVHLRAGERVGRIPEDTALTPLVSFQDGWLKQPGRLGETVVINTETNRTVEGELLEVSPRYTHSFGYRLPAISTVRAAIQAWKAEV